MRQLVLLRVGGFVLLGCLLVATVGKAQVKSPTKPPSRPSTPTAFVPRFEAIAETRLLMEGLAHSNYRSLDRMLRGKPADADSWAFARGQAILIAETGNLLLLRPPRNSGRDTWMKLAMEMRGQAQILAKHIAARDQPRSLAALDALAASCNRCHQTFRVATRIGPERERGESDTE